MSSGKFIALEGSEGVGKSTNITFIRDYLSQRGIPLLLTREPGGTPFGESARQVLLGTGEIVGEAELLLLFAARAQHLSKVIEPALASGHWVISDRFTEASYAYQGGGRGIDWEVIEFLENWIQKGLKPDLTLLLDAPIDIGMARVQARGQQDRFEKENKSFFQRVRDTYLSRAANSKGRIKIIDATQPLTQVQAVIATHLDTLMQS